MSKKVISVFHSFLSPFFFFNSLFLQFHLISFYNLFSKKKKIKLKEILSDVDSIMFPEKANEFITTYEGNSPKIILTDAKSICQQINKAR